MPRVLLIEDDQYKSEQVSEFLRLLLPGSSLTLVASVNSAMRALTKDTFNLVLMDMSLPTFDIGPSEAGGRPQGFGGRELMRYMERLSINTPVVIVTQFERFGQGKDAIDLNGLRNQLVEHHPDVFRGLVFYSAARESWKSELQRVIKGLLPN